MTGCMHRYVLAAKHQRSFRFTKAISTSTMRNTSTAITHLLFLCILLFAGSSAQLIYLQKPHQKSQLEDLTLNIQAPEGHQIVMDSRGQGGGVLLSDFMSTDRSISEFSGLTRSIEAIATRLGDMTKKTTVLAPKNSIISSLPRKPWEGPHDEEEASAQGTVSDELYRGDSGEDRAARNLERFVEAHLVDVSPWPKGKSNQAKTLGGKTLWWDEDGGVIKIYPDGVEVEDIKEDVPNGQIWIIKGVITP